MTQSSQLTMGMYKVGGLNREDNMSHLRKRRSKLTEKNTVKLPAGVEGVLEF